MGIRDRPIAPRSPWQNPYVERLIGTLRRECLDHILIIGERHLHRILAAYSSYYNETRTHLGLAKDTPIPRAVQRSGTIVTALGRLADRGKVIREVAQRTTRGQVVIWRQVIPNVRYIPNGRYGGSLNHR
jgi:transposase InsO family protein